MNNAKEWIAIGLLHVAALPFYAALAEYLQEVLK